MVGDSLDEIDKLLGRSMEIGKCSNGVAVTF